MASGKTQNGQPIDPPLRQFTVPGTGVTLTLISNTDIGTILMYGASMHHSKVRPLDGGQCGGYDKRPIGGLGGTTSNHRSGTACDLNYTVFPQGSNKMNAAQQQAMRGAVAFCEGALRWGGDYGGGSLLDQHHIEINTTDQGLLRRVAQKISGATGGGVNPIVGSTPTDSTANTPAVVKEPLPSIGPAAQHALIPMTGGYYVDLYNRLSQVKIAGNDMTGDFTNAVQSVNMSFSSTQVGQFSMTVMDTPDGAIIGSGIVGKETTIDFNDQHLIVTGMDIRPYTGSPQLTIKAQSRVISVLRGPEHTGKGTWGEQDVAGWVRDRCREAGAIALVQDNLGTLTFNRQEYDAVESTWDVMQKAARQTGCWCYEFEQNVVFMRPTALASRNRAKWWDLQWTTYTNYTNGLAGQPSFSWANGSPESLSVQLLSGDADLARPGDGLTMAGNMGQGNGDWIITQVDVPGNITEPVNVSCLRIIDPTPEAVTTS